MPRGHERRRGMRRWGLVGLVGAAALASPAVAARTPVVPLGLASAHQTHEAVPAALPACVATQAYLILPPAASTPVQGEAPLPGPAAITQTIPLLTFDATQNALTTTGPQAPGAGAGRGALGDAIIVVRPTAVSALLLTQLANGGRSAEVDAVFVATRHGVRTVCRIMAMKLVSVGRMHEHFGPGEAGGIMATDTITLTYGALSFL